MNRIFVAWFDESLCNDGHFVWLSIEGRVAAGTECVGHKVEGIG